ncbi:MULTISPECIES: XTP/dITP diphosphatase [Metabacillus]|uniref:dITP/XTP pyrophosphatase n=3 Tax=Metabacillus TaxID=2675233 RepID=A0A179STP7_9BACI|nr:MULTISPECIES: XTP/dITP diphosphatase [Metabacillus]OAS84891.1 non-canonical purine NTP pyrophosphatase [Metabacillus litoralis]QNF26417.1 XTP/dITP diphosphatase [Metabacillus sp. KUDC1714]
MKEIIIATKNQGKVKEFEALLAPIGFRVQSLLDYPDSIDVEETGKSFEENAILKAEAIAMHYQRMTIADDSGLAIDYLGGKPGIFSARYAGPDKNDQSNINKVLEDLSDVHALEDRSARFICALAISIPGEKTKTVVGTCEGYIATEPQGENGFGYDPIFILKNRNQTMANLTKEEKNQISHRAVALKKVIEVIKHS